MRETINYYSRMYCNEFHQLPTVESINNVYFFAKGYIIFFNIIKYIYIREAKTLHTFLLIICEQKNKKLNVSRMMSSNKKRNLNELLMRIGDY